MYCREFPGVFDTDGAVLTCKLCAKPVNFSTRFQVTQHLEGAKHKKNVALNKPKQPLLKLPEVTRAEKWCDALTSAGIPFSILEDGSFRDFLEKELKYSLLSESCVRKTYLEKVVSQKKASMQEDLEGKDLFVMFDEATFNNRPTFAALVGDCKSPKTPYLLGLSEPPKMNADYVIQAISKWLYQTFNCVQLSAMEHRIA